jgi:hypothetical protein
MDWAGFALSVRIPSFLGFVIPCMYTNFAISFCHKFPNGKFVLFQREIHGENTSQDRRIRRIKSVSETRDKMKDNAIAQLTDQLVSLSARLQEIERKQMC